jgi:predicted transcriptional regulator
MEPLDALTAEDVMSSPVISLDVDTSLSEAAQILSEQQVSGALVTDHRNAPVGVVSLNDVVTYLAGLTRSAEHPGGFYRYSYPAISEGGEGWESQWEDVEPEPLSGTTVGEIMATEILTVPKSLPIREVAKILWDRHIHRIFVAGENGPSGVISTMDVLKIIAKVESARRSR